ARKVYQKKSCKFALSHGFLGPAENRGVLGSIPSLATPKALQVGGVLTTVIEMRLNWHRVPHRCQIAALHAIPLCRLSHQTTGARGVGGRIAAAVTAPESWCPRFDPLARRSPNRRAGAEP